MSFARYWRRICDEYVKGGRFDEVYDRIRNQIDELVETDPNAQGGNMPDMGGFGSATLSGTSKLMTLIVYGLCLLFMLALLIGVSLIRRRRLVSVS